MTFRQWGKMPVGLLIEALDDESPYVRRYVAMTLGYKKSKEATDYANWVLGKIEESL